MMKKLLTLLILLLQVVNLFAQEKNNIIEGYLTSAERKVDQPFLERFNTSERGNITFIANNILNRSSPDPDIPYDGFTGNHSFDLQYIDIDGFVDLDGDGNDDTFSSSRSTLNLPNCSEILYAGLYWAGIYPYDNWSEEPGPNSRDSDFNEIKFRIPGGNYIDIIADKFDVTNRELIYDDGITTEKPYVCYKDVTTILQGLTDVNGSPIPNGEYFGANIKATRGRDNVSPLLGSSAGWVLVVIYKNENESSKKFYLFDGFSTIKRSTNPFTDVNVTGFQTVPSGPVRASLLVGALEGDRSISGDAFQIERPSGGFETLTTGSSNTTNNFFNGSITFNNNHLTNRQPDSENTLGFDVDLFSLNNPTKSILNNNQTETTLRFTTTGDSYWPFLLGMAVEIIEPKIQLIKTIEDAAGNPVPPNMGVDFGDEIFYSIKFQNVGTDNALNTELIDLLPTNVDLIESGIILPAGLTAADYTYTPPAIGNGFRGELKFNIPNSMVTENGAEYEIKLKVQVVSSCNDLRDVCSNVIMNQAFANYDSDKGGTPRVINEPSFSGIDACNLGAVGTSNFLIDTSGCTFERTQILCGASTDLVAGAGFASYSWENTNNLGVVIGTSQILTVTQGGTYIVTKTVPNNSPAGCVSTTETVHVTAFNTVTNPLIPFVDQVLKSCPNNIELAEIYLCGNAGSRDINLPFVVPPAGVTGTTVRWFELVSCPTPTTITGCANVASGCSWTDLGTDFSKTFTAAGEYKLEVLYDGQCPKTYYFNVYNDPLTPTIVKEDLICGASANIVINNIPNGYEYSLTGPGGFNAPFQTSNTFTVTAPGDYNLSIRLANGSTATCIYTFPAINIQETTIALNVTTTNMQCANEPAQIRTQVSGAPGDYTYVLTQGASIIATEGPTANNDFTFNVTDGGNYTVTVSVPNVLCIASEDIVITEPDELNLTAIPTKDISCLGGTSNGIITLNPSGGVLSGSDVYSFAIWSKDGTPLYANISDIPATAYFTNTTHQVINGQEGVYTFIVVDSNNCTTISTPVTINVEPELQFNHTATNISCNGLTDGSINVNVVGSDLGFSPIEYSVNGAGGPWNTTGVFNNLSANPNYTVTIRASKTGYQCDYEITNIAITEPSPLTGGDVVGTDYECNTAGNTILGTLTFTPPTVGSGAYTYYYKLSTDATFIAVTGVSVSGLVSGTYNVKVEDARGCERNLTDVVIDPIPGAPILNHSIEYNCEGEGTITVTPFNATYSYTLDGGTPQTGVNANIFANTAVGNHTIRVNYFGNCRLDLPVTVQPGNIFSGSIDRWSDSECFGADNGTITIGATNIVGTTFEYSTDGGTTWSATSDNPYRVIGLAADTYNVFIRETDGGKTCVIDLGNVVITQPDELTLSASATQIPTCVLPSTGTITAVASGGVPPYEFSIDNGASWQTSPIFSNVPARATDYIVMIRDSRNCNECGCTSNLFENGSFELPARAGTTFRIYNENNVPGWDSTASDNRIEIWYNNFNGVPAHDGVAHAELNANLESSLFQEYCTQPGDVISWSVAHRGRSGTDVATVKIGDDLATASVVETMSDGRTAWGVYSGTYTVPVGQSTTVIAFDAVSTASGSISVGNFIDDVKITIARNNCIPVSIPLIEPTPVAFTVTPEVCYDGTNGTLKVNVTTGNGNYIYSLDGGTTTQTSNVFTGLTDGTYNVTVTDGLSCTIPAVSATINPQITATVVPTNEICSALGVITITPGGGDGNYQYVVTPLAPTVGAVITTTTSPINVAAGTYSVSVRDQGGAVGYCEYSENVTITRIADPTVVVTAVQPDCSGGTGTVNIAISNGTSDYRTTLTLQGAPGTVHTFGPSSDAAISFGTLAEGTYDVLVTDANGCMNPLPETVTITAPNAIGGDSRQSQDYTCLQLGEITVENVVGGTPPYTYTLNDGVTTTTYTTDTVTFDYVFTGLTDGTYTIIISDDKGCNFTTTPAVVIPVLPTAPALTSAVVYNCDGTGNITITPAPAGTYNYTLGATTNTTGIFNDLSDGTYTVTVDYGSDCTVDVLNITILDNQEFTAVVTNQTNPVCIGDTNGTIEVTASFPSTVPTDFDYSLDGGGTWIASGANPFTIPSLDEGTYNILVKPTGAPVTDCNITLDPVILSDPSPIVVAATVTKDITCDADPTLDGATITITPTTTGGNGAAYTYELFDNATATGAAVQTGAPFTDIDTAGDYWVVAIDVESCRSTPVLVNVPVRETIIFTAVPQCYDGANGVIDINIASGNGTYEYSLDGATWQTPTPANVTSFSITGLSNIGYTVSIRDIAGCIETAAVTINNALVATATPTNASCVPLGVPTGQIEVFPTGGSTTGYVFSAVIDGSAAGTFLPTNPITNLAAGTYDIYVRDDANCEFIIQDVVIEQITPVAITITGNQPTCNGRTGSIKGVITANTGQSPHTITIADSGGIIVARTLTGFIGTNFNFDNLPAETYTVEITDDLGCTESQSVTLTDPPSLTMTIVPVRPNCGDPFVGNETQFGFNITFAPPITISAPYKIQYSSDNGVTWQDNNDFRGTNGSPDFDYGTVSFPAVRITDIATSSITYCLENYGSYTMPYVVSPLVVNISTNSLDCTTGATVDVEVDSLTGVGGFEYSYNIIPVAPGPIGWEPSNGATIREHQFTGLTPGGTYYFFVRDLGDNNCVKVDRTFIIDIDVFITPSIISQSCNGGATGSLQFDIDDTKTNILTGGVPSINWEFFNLNVVTGVSTSIQTGTQSNLDPILPAANGTLTAGTYYVKVYNNAGTCTFASPNIEILETAPINATLTVVSDITCSTNGVIGINATGGTEPYTYSVASSVNFLPADATVSGTTIEFAYADVTDPTLDVTGINITITDSNGNSCTTTVGPESLVVGQLPNIISSTPNSCGINKTITTRVNSGTGPYQFSVDAGAFSSSIALDGGLGYAEFIAENLTPGNHIITIRDANGCTVTTNSDIQQSLEYTVTSTKNLTCDTPSPADEATYDVNVTSGSGAYTYEVTGTVSGVVVTAGTALPSNPFTFSTAVAEDYTIIITDTAETPNCTLTKTFEVKAALQPVFTTNVVDATCNGSANGSIGVSVTAGLTPYTYSIVQTVGAGLLAGQATWDAASNSFIAVPAGTYTVTVTGDNGCATDEIGIVVEDNDPLIVTAPTAVQFACAANTNNVQNATLSIDTAAGVSGGSLVYQTVRLYHDVNNDSPGITTDDVEVTTVTVTGTDHVFIITDVAGGSYYVEVVDSASCMSLSASTIINAFDAITDITITQVKAIDCTTGDNITVKTLTDIANVTYNIISAPAGYVPTVELVALGTSSASFTDLPTGTYEITATHPVTGCVFTKEYTVDAEPAFTAIANNPQTTCFGVSGGSIDVSFDVSTPYTLGYDYEVLTSAGASLVPTVTGSGVGNVTRTIGSLPAGTYYVSINMSPNTPFCTIQTNEFTIVEPTAILSVSGIVDPGVSCTGISDATITATGADGFGGYTYQLEVTGAPNVPYRAGDAFATNLNNNVFTGLPAGNYTIRVRDVNGCEGASADVVVAAPVAVTFGVTELDNSCDTSVGGSIEVTAAGGTGSYTYVLTNSGGVEVGNTGVIATTTHTFTNLSAEVYTVSVTDSNGCAAPAGAAITISEDLVFSLATTKDLTCSIPMAGTVVITVASGSNNYTYEIAGPSAVIVAGTAFISGQTFSPTVAGTYTVTVTDEDASPAACPVVRTIDIAAALQPMFTAVAVIDDICNGSSDGAITMTPVNNGISPLTYTIAPIAGTLDVATSTFEDLPAGIYTITATGTNGCSSIRNVTITENADIDISGAVTISEFGCTTGNETNNAVVSVNTVGAGGTGNFVRAVFVYDNGTPGDTTDDLTQDSGVFSYTVTNEGGGQITVTVFDDNNCSDTIIRTINPFARITGVTVTSQKAIDCNNGEDIIATYSSTIAIANVEYRLYNDTTGLLLEPIRTIDGDFISLLATGNYRIEIENTDTNCVFTEYYTVNETPEYELIVNNIQRACSGGNGSVDLIFNPSTPYVDIYSYEVFNVGGVTTGQIGNGIGNAVTTINTLPGGDYYIVVNMPNTPFCTVTSGNFTIEEPADALTLSEELTYLKCNVLTSGEVDLTAQGGWGAYEYELINTTTSVTIQNFGNNNVITGLEAGNYQATVRDANNCTVVITFQLDPGTTITGSYTVTPNDCIGEYTATIEAINVLGGQLQDAPINYMYALEYPDGTRTTTQASPIFTNLSAGVGYSVIVSDGYSCDGRVGPIDIVDPTKTVASANITADITCNTTQATVEVSGAGGTGPYEFSIDGVNFLAPNAGPNHIFSVGAGEHQFYVRDTESCISNPRIITISSYIGLTATLDTASAFITCNGDANAVLSANAENGLGNYEYQLLDASDTPIDGTWQISNSFSNLDVGTYKINVRSTKGGEVCSIITGQYTITEPLPLVGTAVATQNVTCFGSNTGIITATGQEGNGDYEFNIVSEPSSPEYPENKYVKNGVFENLGAGVYWVTVKDIVGCINAPIRVEILEPDELEISLVSVTEQICLSSPTPIITVDVQGGTQPYYISINNVEFATPYNQNQITIGAAAGIEANTTYLISVRDSGGGCPPKSIAPLTTIESVDLELTVDFEYTCPTGNIIKAIVADKYKNNMSYSLYLGGALVTANTTGEFIDVAAGNGYTVTATDTVTSCSESLVSDPIDIEDIQALTMTIDDSQKNKLIANVDFGLPPYSFTVDGVDYEDENEIVILQTKDYTITVTDARGCEVTITIEGVYITITVLNLFTPDGDGVNDFWYPLEVESYHNLKVYIFDRYAREITKFRGMQQGWDGTYDGKPLPAGDYWYTLYYNELSGEEKKLMGHFTLYR